RLARTRRQRSRRNSSASPPETYGGYSLATRAPRPSRPRSSSRVSRQVGRRSSPQCAPSTGARWSHSARRTGGSFVRLSSHNSTFGGNALACAAGTAALGVTVRERLWERADRLGTVAMEELRNLEAPSVREVRGLGLMIGIELRGKAAPVLQALQEDRVIA